MSMDKQLRAKIGLLLEPAGDDCTKFILAYGQFVELYDDYVDKDTDSNVTLEKLTDAHGSIFSSNYWRKNADRLFLVEKLILLQYHISNEWALSNIEWLKRDAIVLSHTAYNMLIAVLILECGYQVAREIAIELMFDCHKPL